MSDRSLRARGSSRSSSRRTPRSRNRLLRNESLEPRAMLSGTSTSLWTASHAAAMFAPPRVPVNAAPAVAQSINVGSAADNGRSVSLAVLGRDDGGESNLVYTWSVKSAPAGGTASFSANGSNAAKYTTVAFTKAGTYSVSMKIADAAGRTVTNTKSVTVAQTLSSVVITTSKGQALNPASPLAVAGTGQAFAARGLDQFGSAMSKQPSFTWAVTTIPAGAAQPGLATKTTGATLTFHAAGNYAISVQARSASGSMIGASASINVVQVLRSLRNASTATVYVSGTTLTPTIPTCIDQFGNAFVTTPALTWSTASQPSGAPAPVFTTSGGVTTVTFGMAGTYMLSARGTTLPGLTFVTNVVVNQTLTTISVSPGTSTVRQGYDQQFTAQGLDQFRRALGAQPAFSWSVTAGTISASGKFTASGAAGACTVTARSGSVSGTASVTVVANSSGGFNNMALAGLVQSLDADGSISRQDMIQILRSTGIDGVVDAAEFSDLKKLLNQATTFNIASYVQILAGDVVNGNAANAKYQGQTLGNLAAGSTAAQLNKLVDKWFLGTDHPTLCNTSLVYRATSGSLFAHTPSHSDEYQGQLGDCYFISALGTLGRQQPGRRAEHVHRQRRRDVHGPLLHRPLRDDLQLQRRQHQRRLLEQPGDRRLRDR